MPWLKRKHVIVAVVAVICIIGLRPWTIARSIWIQVVISSMARQQSPRADCLSALPTGKWVLQDVLVFEKGWAAFRCCTFHRSEIIGDRAVIRTSEGKVYVSAQHFCRGIMRYWDERQPKDINDFLSKYEQSEHWLPR